jgi:hypothetical protein
LAYVQVPSAKFAFQLFVDNFKTYLTLCLF